MDFRAARKVSCAERFAAAALPGRNVLRRFSLRFCNGSASRHVLARSPAFNRFVFQCNRRGDHPRTSSLEMVPLKPCPGCLPPILISGAERVSCSGRDHRRSAFGAAISGAPPTETGPSGLGGVRVLMVGFEGECAGGEESAGVRAATGAGFCRESSL